MSRALVNFFYAHPVGHAVEALHYAHGHHVADPEIEVSVALNAETAVELARHCPFVERAYAIDHPLLEPCGDSSARLAELPREWDWIADDPRRWQAVQLALFPGLRDYYAASDEHLRARRARTIAGAGRLAYAPHQPLRFELPAARSLDGERWIAVMPAGASERSLYPSLASWRLILDALAEAYPNVRFALVGRTGATTLDPGEHAALLGHAAVDAFDLELAEQLAIVQACDVFLAPHTGFGLAALAVGTPWLAISGGRWFEYYFNHVPFRSVIPDVERYPCFSQFAPAATIDDGEDGPRTPSMSRARILDDRERIVEAAGELLAGTVTYEQALCEYFAALLAAHDGDAAGTGRSTACTCGTSDKPECLNLSGGFVRRPDARGRRRRQGRDARADPLDRRAGAHLLDRHRRAGRAVRPRRRLPPGARVGRAVGRAPAYAPGARGDEYGLGGTNFGWGGAAGMPARPISVNRPA